MAVDARSYFAARGDLELVGLNRELGRLPIALDAFVDFAATRRNDGVQLGIFYRPVRALTLLAAAPDDGGWFLENAFADHVDLVFSAPVDKSSISLGTFAWWWAGGTEEVDPVDIVFSELDRQLRIEKPTLPADYTGPLSLTFADVDSAETDPLAEAITLQYDITETGSAKPQTGAKSYERQIVTGSLAVSRLVIPTGQQVDAMLKAFLRHKGLESHRILKVVQVQGPNTTVEVFLLWWRATSPRLVSVSPKSSGTLPFESPPESVVLQFDQPVQSPAAYLHFDDVLGTNVAFTTTKLDEQGRQWQVVKSGGLFTAVGQHTLRIAGLPNLTGDLPGPPSVFSWQVQPLTVSGSSDHGDLGGLGDDDHLQYVHLNPLTTARNRMQAGVIGAIPLSIRRLAGQTADMLRLEDETGAQPLVRFDAAGNLILGGAPFTFPGGGSLITYDTTGFSGFLPSWGANLPTLFARGGNAIFSAAGGGWSYDDYFSPADLFDVGFPITRHSYLSVRKHGVFMGLGSPEGIVTAPPGSFYYRRDGAAGTMVYSKLSGTGNTGWIAFESLGMKSAPGGYAALDANTRVAQEVKLIHSGTIAARPASGEQPGHMYFATDLVMNGQTGRMQIWRA